MRFFVDIDKAITLHLEGAELLVFSALSLLASHKPWSGTKEQLANLSRCGSRLTASRALDRLMERGLVVKTADGYNVQNEHANVQNEHENVQNEHENVQNEQNLRESNKENNNKLLIKGERDISRTPTREFGENNFSKNDIWDRPASIDEYKSYAIEKNCLKKTYKKFYRHYESIGWFGIRNWRAKFLEWIEEDNEKEKERAARDEQRRQLLNPNYR